MNPASDEQINRATQAVVGASEKAMLRFLVFASIAKSPNVEHAIEALKRFEK